MIIANVRAGHVLVLHTSNALADFLTLDVLHVTKHGLLTEIFLRQIVSAQSGCVIGRQGDQVVEDTCPARRIGLEGADFLISSFRQLTVVIVRAHQLIAFIC